MTSRRDLEGEMSRNPIDDGTAERLLAGGLSPDDAPPGYAGMAELLRATRAPGTEAELAGAPALVAAMAEVVRSVPGIRHTPLRRKKLLSKVLTAKAASVFAASVLGATAAAAATGNLPAPAQNAIASAASSIGVNVPNKHANAHAKANAAKHGHHGQAGPDGANSGNGPGPDGSNDFGLCTAFLAHFNGTTSTTNGNDNWMQAKPFQALMADHGNSVDATKAACQTVVNDKAQQNGTGNDQAGTQGNGSTNGTDHGQSSGHKPQNAGSQGSTGDSTGTTGSTDATEHAGTAPPTPPVATNHAASGTSQRP